MTLSYLYDMHDVIGFNVFLRKLMRFQRMQKINSVPTLLLTKYEMNKRF